MSEIGTIGAIYEDQRTKKQGKLIERDEKYKTLLMESEDGKSFNITFGGFKSNWRKVDEPEQTLEEAMQEEIPESNVGEVQVEEEKKPVEKKSKQTKTKTDVVKTLSMDPYVKTFESYVASLNSDKVSLNFIPAKAKKNPLVVFKIGRNKFIDMYLRAKGHFWIMMPEFVYSQTTWSIKLINVVNTPKNRREISCSIDCADLDKFLENIRHSFVEVLSAKVEEGK